MTCLFLDTSSSYLNSAVIKDDKVLKSIYIELDKNMSKMALFSVKEMLDSLNIKPIDIDKIIIANGPGSYTGLRVGVTMAKTFAWGLNKELVTISSLYVLASSIKDVDYIIPLIDARRDFVFAAIYDKNYNAILEDCYISKNDLLEKVNSLDGSYKFVSTFDIKDIDTIKYNPDIDNLIKHMKEVKINPHELVPNYLKKVEAEENLHD